MKEFINELLSEEGKISALRLVYLSSAYAALILLGCTVWMSFARVDLPYVITVGSNALTLYGLASGSKVWQKKIESKVTQPSEPAPTVES